MKYPEQIEIVWTVDDVLGLSPTSGGRTYSDLGMTRQEAAKVLNEVKRTHDPEYGVSWVNLRFWAEKLFGNKYSE